MKTIRQLIDTMPQEGRLEVIQLRSQKRGSIIAVPKANLDMDKGITGDHYSKLGGKRMITLIQLEHLKIISAWLEVEDVASLPRRNLVISGINLLALHDRRFSIGRNVVLQGTGHCHPCSRMETNLGPGGYNAMRGHGGITAMVIQGGQIKIGDNLKIRL